MNESRRRFWVLAGATVAVLGVAYGPLLVEFFGNQWERPHYQYFPFVLGAFGWLLWQRCSLAEWRGASGEGRGAALCIAMAVGLLALAYLVDSPWVGYLSFICLATNFFWRVAGGWRVPYLWGIWLLLWLVLPLPLSRDQALISFLQQLSSRLSSYLLDWFGVVHLMEGNTLLVAGKQFFVDEACSGIVSVLSIIACAVIYGVWRMRPPVHLVLLALAGIGWATLMNVMRISVIAMAYEWYGVDWSAGTPHETLGLAIFLLTFLALVSTDYALVGLLAPIKAADGQCYGEAPRFGAWLVEAWDWLVAAGAAAGPKASSERRGASGEGGRELAGRFVLGVMPLVVFGVLASAQLVIPRVSAAAWGGREPHNLERALALDAGVLPQRCVTLDRVSFEPQERARDDVFGNYSRTYEYRDEQGTMYLVSCDFPLEPEGHELTVCYQGIGWHMARREVHAGENDASPADHEPAPEWGYAEADFAKPDGGAAFLVFCSFDEYGARVTPPTRSLWDDLWRSLQRPLLQRRSERTFQVQVWTTGLGTIDERQKKTARALLVEVRERFREQVMGEGSGERRGAGGEELKNSDEGPGSPPAPDQVGGEDGERRRGKGARSEGGD